MRSLCKPGWFVVVVFSLSTPVVFAQEHWMSRAEKFAWNLQESFKNEGYDIDVIASDARKTLVLTSDLFKDAATREDQAHDLLKNRRALCEMGIWYVEVGYSRGMFSSDVAKKMSLGCPAEKVSRVQETKEEREKYAAGLNSTSASSGIHVSVSNTTLLFESNFFSDSTNRSLFVRKMLGDPGVVQNLCRLYFSQLQLRSKQRLMKTAPVVCK